MVDVEQGSIAFPLHSKERSAQDDRRSVFHRVDRFILGGVEDPLELTGARGLVKQIDQVVAQPGVTDEMSI